MRGKILFCLVALVLLVGTVSALTYTSQYPPGHNTTYVKATSVYDPVYQPYYATNPSLSLTGYDTDNQWYSVPSTNQRFHIDLGSAKIITRIYYENSHNIGTQTDYGSKNFTVYGSNTAGSFATLTYANDTGWVAITATSPSSFTQHTASDVADPKYNVLTNTIAYRYYAIKIANSWGALDGLGLRRIVLQTDDVSYPVASFTANQTSGAPPLPVQFNDTSTNSPTAWNWSYQNATPGNNTQIWWSITRNATQTFGVGNWSIKLNASNAVGYNITPGTYWINVSSTVGVTAHFYTTVSGSSYGATDSNPTGSPIGGGTGYTNIITSGNYIATTKANLISNLSIASPGQTVFVAAGTSIDVTGTNTAIEIPAGVTLASDRGNGGSSGGLIYRTDVPSSALGTFAITGNGARITGLRIRGSQGGYDTAYGANIRGAIVSYSGYNYTIDNNEIYNWSYAGVGIEEGPTGATPVWVHHNNFHNISDSDYGYAIGLGAGGKVLFEANLIDGVRHAIVTDGNLAEEYEARYNILGASFINSGFDTHPNPAPPSNTSRTGAYYNIHHNTINSVEQSGISVGGTPVNGAYIDHNLFPSTDTGTYQWQSAQQWGNVYVTENKMAGTLYNTGTIQLLTYAGASPSPPPTYDVWSGYIPKSLSNSTRLTVNFTDISYRSPTGWNWSYRDVTGNNTQIWWSTSQNTSLSFGVGNFSIVLTATSTGSSNTTSSNFFINVSSTGGVTAPVSSFTLAKSLYRIPGTTLVNDTSTNSPSIWNYSWGDGTWTNGTTQHPTHKYSERGQYSITLLCSNAGGSNTSATSKVRIVGYDQIS